MNLPSRLSLILLSLLPSISTQSTNLTTPLRAANFQCTRLSIYDLRLGTLQNCAAAILALPQNTQTIPFHTAGAYDLGRLPAIRIFGDCMVDIDLRDMMDVSSWTAIGLAASLLMSACSDVSLNRAYTGGSASAGNTGGITVTLQRYEAGVGAANTSGLLDE